MNTPDNTGAKSAISAQSSETEGLTAQNALFAQPKPTYIESARRHLKERTVVLREVDLLRPRHSVPAAPQKGKAGPEEEVASDKAIEALLEPYSALIAQAERGELLKGKPIRLSVCESTTDLNFVVLQACQTFRAGFNAPRRVVRGAARAQIELLSRCQLAQENGGDAIRPKAKESGATVDV